MKNKFDYSKNIDVLETRVIGLEKLVQTLESQITKLKQQTSSHVLRLNNKEELSLDFIVKNSRYQDLSPEKAFDFYNNKDKNFILLDVSSEEFQPIADFPEVMNIPLEILRESLGCVPNKAESILVISEDGRKSILACEILSQAGYFNLNNVSGGYKYWVGFNNLRKISESA